MKRKMTVIILVLCLAVLLIVPPVEAAGNICFTAINDKLQPLDDNKMPAIIGGLLYVPSGFFTSDELGVYYLTGGNRVMLYNASKQLIFNTQEDVVADQDNHPYKIPAEKKNGLIYLPVDEVCVFFGLTYDFIQSDPAPVLRFYSSAVPVSQSTFISVYKTTMEIVYKFYVENSSKPSPSPSSPVEPTFENVTVYLSFNNLAPENFKAVLDALNLYRLRGCFFVTADEIASADDLVRRAAGAGHTIGIWLEKGTLDEYQSASDLLFEAAKVKTVLVSAEGDDAKTAQATAESNWLIFWKPVKSLSESAKLTIGNLKNQLSTQNSSRASINISCTDKMVPLAKSLLGYLSEKKFDVRRITETTVPTYSIG